MTTVSPFYRLFLTGTISAIMLISCSSRTPKADDAFELVKKERMQSNDSSFVSNKIIQESMKIRPFAAKWLRNLIPSAAPWAGLKGNYLKTDL